jgi:NAD(P)-dependent dehydrogenase (short-subunit alcohol dehydrogenase family)
VTDSGGPVPKRLTGKVIIVAGGGGIGDELARRYAAEGASVVLSDIVGAAAQRAAAEISDAGGSAIGIELDGSEDERVRSAVALAQDRFGGLDGFHANFASFADGESGADILDLPLDILDEVMRVNARGFVLCTRHAVPAMLARGGGAMVYTSSGAAYAGETVRCAYAMSKAAGHALMRHVARRFGPQGIRANVIAPGVVAHPRFYEALDAATITHLEGTNPLHRLGSPADIAAMGALLMSDEGRFITGQVLSIDGGNQMRS